MQKEWEVLYTATNILIHLDRSNKILICSWKGFQHEKPLKDTGQIIRKLFKQHKCTKVLNDNREVIGPWYHSTEWTSEVWFPDMIKAGLKHFAWVCPQDMFAQLSAERALPQQQVVKEFAFVEEAIKWLKEQE